MSSPIASAAVAAVLRSASPGCREGHPADRLAFAAHACVLAAGHRLVASGADAASARAAALLDRAAPPPQQELPDAPLAGDWNAGGEDGDEYTFLYAPEEEGGRMLLLKCLLLGGGGGGGEGEGEEGGGGVLVATLAAGGCGGAAASAAPQTVELPLAQFVDAGAGSASGTPAVAGVRNLPELCARVGEALARATGAGARAAAGAASEAAAAGGSSGRRAGRQGNDDDDDGDDDPLRAGPCMRPPPRGLHVGEEDVMPLGGGGIGGIGGIGGGGSIGGGPLPLGPGGGMHVGPHHPFFADRMRHQPPGGLPPGARWDPIRPEGLEGWSPDDFVPPPGEGGGGGIGGGLGRGGPGGRGRGGSGPGGGGRNVHPDIMPPGPGRGADWDSMFG